MVLGKRRGKSKKKAKAAEQPAPEPEEQAADAPAEPEQAASADETDSPPAPEWSFDAEASQRTLRACSGIYSAAQIAVAEGNAAAAPFLSFGQKSRIQSLATDFETRRMARATDLLGPVPTAETSPVVTETLAREDVEGIVTHRVEIAVQEALHRLGIAPDSALADQVERQVQLQLGAQEQRLMERIRQAIEDSMSVISDVVDERIADSLAAQGAENEEKAAVDAQVEEAREALLKNIDEVRSVDTGFEIGDLDIEGIASISDAAAPGQVEDEGLLVEAGADDDDLVVEAAGDDDLVVEAAGDDDLVVEAAGDDDLVVEAAGDDDLVVEAAGDDDLVAEAAGDDSESSPAEEALASDEDAALTHDLDTDALEEISVVEEASSDDEADGSDVASIDLEEDVALVLDAESEADVAALRDALQVDLDDDNGDGDEGVLLSLGEGPEDLIVAVGSEDDETEEPHDARLEDELEEGDDEEAVERYLLRAAEMRSRRQPGAAMELYSKVLEIDSSSYEARIGRGVLHLEAKSYNEAIDEFSEAEKLDPARPASALGLAEVHFHRKQFNKAIRYYTQCLNLDDGLAQAYCNRGLSYYYRNNYKKAFLDLMRAYELDVDLPNIKKYLKLVRNKVQDEKSSPGASS